ncbi:MAG: Rieske 2Fe-2S domain-containing protein [Emcibacter sp.]|nr:Rieske 2Fe-2S domain-containing protein [Emcibacter sp.]
MTNQTAETSKVGQRNWPPGVTRVPYWVFQDEAVYQMEQQRLFRGESWNYLCLETELAEAGDFRTSYVGETHVIITRDMDGEIYAFENRCAHRGALLTYEVSGKTKNFSCVYHGWGHSLQGDLDSVAFMDGLNGSGGMRPSFCKHKFGPKKMRVAVVHGLVFGSFSNDVPSIEEYLGEEILERIARVLAGRKMVVIGRYTQNIPNNWKLYAENTKDSYHASILHFSLQPLKLIV